MTASAPHSESNEAGKVTIFCWSTCGWIAFVVGLPNELRIATDGCSSL
jgi:hypothetical protein